MIRSDAPLIQDDDGVLIHYIVVTGDGRPEYMQVYFDREEVDCVPEGAPCEDCVPPSCDRGFGADYCETCESGGDLSSCEFGNIGSHGRNFSDRLPIVGDLSAMLREKFIIVEIFHTYDPLLLPGQVFGTTLFQGVRDMYNYSLMLIEY